MTEITLSISGMHCGGCVSSVRNVLSALPGVEHVDVSLDPGQAVVRYDAARLQPSALAQAIADAGFTVTS